MKKKITTLLAAIVCLATCAFALCACGDKKDKNDVVTQSDWTQYFTAAQSAQSYLWSYDLSFGDNELNENFTATPAYHRIGYDAVHEQYSRETLSENGESSLLYFWKKDGKYYANNNDGYGTMEIAADRFTRNSNFQGKEKPFLIDFCKDKFSKFKYYGSSTDSPLVYYKAKNIAVELNLTREGGFDAIRGTGFITVTVDTKAKSLVEIQCKLLQDDKTIGYVLQDIDAYDYSGIFDGFSLPQEA